jgi:hypothetical protein
MAKLVGDIYQPIGSTLNGTFLYDIGNTFKFVAIPSSGWEFQKYCNSDPCTAREMVTTDSFTGTITRPTGNLYVYTSPLGQSNILDRSSNW